MFEFKLIKNKKDLGNVYSFRTEIFQSELPQAVFDGRDGFDNTNRTHHFIAAENGKIFAYVRLIRGTEDDDLFHLPMEKYFSLSLFREKGIIPSEFSQFIASDDLTDRTVLIKFILYVLNWAHDHSVQFLCTLVNMNTHDLETAKILYRTAQINRMIHPDIHTLPFKENGNPGPDSSLQAPAKRPDFGSNPELPVSLRFFAKLGFQITSIPFYLSSYKMYSIPMLLRLEKTRLFYIQKSRFRKAEKSPPAKEINCRTANSIIRYVKTKNQNVQKLLKGIPFSEKYLTDENNWIDCRTVIKLFRNARLLLNDPGTAYKIGFSSGQLKSIGIINVIFKLFSNPLLTFKMFYKFIRLWNRIQTFKITVLAPNRIEVIMSKPHLLPTEDICEFNRGLCAAVPEMWKLKARAEEVNCVRSGDPYCKFRVSWKPYRYFLPRIYYSTIDRIITLIESRIVLRNKQTLLEKQYIMLTKKSRENIRLNRLLDQSNIKLKKIIDGKISDLEKAYAERMDKAQTVRQKERTDIMEYLTGIIAHEVKNNMYSVDLLYDKCLKENLISQNLDFLSRLLQTVRKEQRGITGTDAVEIINRLMQNYRDIDYAVRNSSPILKKSIDLCRLILKNYYRQESEKADISELIGKFYNRNKNSFLADRILLKTHIQNLPGALFNSDDILTLIENLTANSREALKTQKENKNKKIEIRSEVKKTGRIRWLLLEISDNGPGIPAFSQDRIFEPFFSSSVQKQGLGLTFCRKIVNRHRGEITFKSSPGSTVFKVILPIEDKKPDTRKEEQ